MMLCCTTNQICIGIKRIHYHKLGTIHSLDTTWASYVAASLCLKFCNQKVQKKLKKISGANNLNTYEISIKNIGKNEF